MDSSDQQLLVTFFAFLYRPLILFFLSGSLCLYLFCSFAVWHCRLRLLRELNREEFAGRPEVHSDARGGATRRSCAILHGGQCALLPCGRGCSAGQRHALSHHLSSNRYSTTSPLHRKKRRSVHLK